MLSLMMPSHGRGRCEEQWLANIIRCLLLFLKNYVSLSTVSGDGHLMTAPPEPCGADR